MNNDLEVVAKKTKENLGKFVKLGGVATGVALIAGMDQLANNPIAQDVLLYSTVVGGVAFGGALWQLATFEDKKREIENPSPSIKSILTSLRDKFLTKETPSNHQKPNIL